VCAEVTSGTSICVCLSMYMCTAVNVCVEVTSGTTSLVVRILVPLLSSFFALSHALSLFSLSLLSLFAPRLAPTLAVSRFPLVLSFSLSSLSFSLPFLPLSLSLVPLPPSMCCPLFSPCVCMRVCAIYIA